MKSYHVVSRVIGRWKRQKFVSDDRYKASDFIATQLAGAGTILFTDNIDAALARLNSFKPR